MHKFAVKLLNPKCVHDVAPSIDSHILMLGWVKLIHWRHYELRVSAFVMSEVANWLLGRANNVHLRPSWSMSYHDQTRRHHLNNWNSKMLLFHRVNRNFCLFEYIKYFTAWLIYKKLNWVIYLKSMAQVFKLLNYLLVVGTSRRTDQDKLTILR